MVTESESSPPAYGTIYPDHAVVAPAKLLPPRRRRRPCYLCCLFTIVNICLGSVLFWLSVPIFLDTSSCLGPLNPPRPAPKSWNDFQKQSFSVGFDLTVGYGTASISLQNGTIINIGRAEGSAAYTELFARLSLESSVHPTPPYYRCDLEQSDLVRQWQRWSRKNRGLPASDDVAVIAEVLADLKQLTDDWLKAQNISSVVETALIVVPYFPALYMEDLIDAAEYAQFQMLTIPHMIYQSGDARQWPVTEINAAMVGNRFGMSLIDPINYPPDEKHTCPTDNVFSLLLTKKALTAHVGPFASAIHFYAAQGIANFTLGFDSINDFPSEEAYWWEVQQAVRQGMESYSDRGHNIGLVIVHGESADERDFEIAVLNELVRTHHGRMQDMRGSKLDVTYACARGAAEFARLCQTKFDDGIHSCFPDIRPAMQGW